MTILYLLAILGLSIWIGQKSNSWVEVILMLLLLSFIIYLSTALRG